MSGALKDLQVLVLDCQASGATPVLGDLLELGWGLSSATENVGEPRAEWIVPATSRRVSGVVRKLTGWSETCIAHGIEGLEAWRLVRGAHGAERVPTVIHFARFELPFLHDLHARSGAAEAFPLEIACLHVVAERLFPTLPRRNLRALAGHLGHSAELIRRASGHVDATAFIWRALVPRLEELGITTWEQLQQWLATPVPKKREKRVFPLASSTRRALPDAPGVYRFLRPNGDVLYVGKATSLKKRVASHFTAGPRTTERALEMLSQAHALDVTETASTLEAALLETDEIKRLDPPYNVQLRAGERAAWFARPDWTDATPIPDGDHVVGPLPSRGALSALAAVRALLEGAEPTETLRAAAVDTFVRDAPTAEELEVPWRTFVHEHLAGSGSARTRLLQAGARLVAPESPANAPPGWDAARIRRHLERAVADGVALVRRARLLSLLAWAEVTFREAEAKEPRTLVLEAGRIVSREASVLHAPPERAAHVPARQIRLASFDANAYDRLRVLATELRRIEVQGGEVTLRVGKRTLPRRSTLPA